MSNGGRYTTSVVALLAAALWSGCDQVPVSALEPCPKGGIALVAPDAGLPQGPPSPGYGECPGGLCSSKQWSCYGFTCKRASPSDQVANYKAYACSAPQICPDTDAQALVHAVTSGKQAISFLLTNCSTGSQTLRIDKVVVHGDPRCSFADVTATDISSREVRPGDTAAIRVTYDPASLGQDHATLIVHSNAQNSPALPLLICVQAVSSTASRPDGGVWPAHSAQQCRESTTLAGCHK